MSARAFRRSVTLAASLALLVPASPVPARAQASAGAAVASAVARLEGIPDARVRGALAAVLVDAERRGLPLEPIVAKALEGVEKDAPPARIETAVRSIAARLAAARDALAPALSEDEVRAGADALAVGVPPGVLTQLRRVSPRRSTTVPLGVLAELVSKRVPVDRASRAVLGLVQRRASDRQLVALGRDVEQDVATGIAALTALELRMKPLVAALPVPAPVLTTAPAAVPGGVPTRTGP